MWDGLHGRNIDGMVFMDVVKIWNGFQGRSIDGMVFMDVI